MIGPRQHWNDRYKSQNPEELTWYQSNPETSLKLVNASGIKKEEAIIDVGGGSSTLADFLIDDGYSRITVLDISAVALKYSRERLKKFKKRVDWVEADILFYQPKHQFHLWHDRALFHFLTDENDRQKYLESLRRSLVPGGVVILSTFAIDGPGKCSGLDVVRYDQHTIRAEFGPEFDLKEFRGEDHVAPNGSTQKFNYFMFNWMPRN